MRAWPADRAAHRRDGLGRPEAVATSSRRRASTTRVDDRAGAVGLDQRDRPPGRAWRGARLRPRARPLRRARARRTPVLANVRPSGNYLMEDFFYAGGLRALLEAARRPARHDAADGQRPHARREHRRGRGLERRRDPQPREPARRQRRPGGAARQPRARRRGDQADGGRRRSCSSTPARRSCSRTTTTWTRASTTRPSTSTRAACWCCATPARWARPGCRNGASCRSRRSCSKPACATWCASPMRG